MEKYVPDMYQSSIYVIDYNKLYNRGIRCILFDLDNTLAPVNIKEPTEELKKFIENLKKQFKIIIFSNGTKRRVKPFKETLNLDSYSFTCKPFQKNFNKILSNYKQSEVVIIGDQLFTDIVGGNEAGITTILINPISKKDFILTKVNRVREKILMRKLRDNNLFVKGRYYE